MPGRTAIHRGIQQLNKISCPGIRSKKRSKLSRGVLEDVAGVRVESPGLRSMTDRHSSEVDTIMQQNYRRMEDGGDL